MIYFPEYKSNKSMLELKKFRETRRKKISSSPTIHFYLQFSVFPSFPHPPLFVCFVLLNVIKHRSDNGCSGFWGCSLRPMRLHVRNLKKFPTFALRET